MKTCKSWSTLACVWSRSKRYLVTALLLGSSAQRSLGRRQESQGRNVGAAGPGSAHAALRGCPHPRHPHPPTSPGRALPDVSSLCRLPAGPGKGRDVGNPAASCQLALPALGDTSWAGAKALLRPRDISCWPPPGVSRMLGLSRHTASPKAPWCKRGLHLTTALTGHPTQREKAAIFVSCGGSC